MAVSAMRSTQGKSIRAPKASCQATAAIPTQKPAIRSARRLDGMTTVDTAIDMEGKIKEKSRTILMVRENRNQALLKTREPLVPPKPKEFLTAMSIGMERAVLAQ